MTPRSGIPGHFGVDLDGRRSSPAPINASLTARGWARMFAARYDQRIERGDAVTANTPLAAHYGRLHSHAERTDLAATLTMLLAAADGGTTRVPIRFDAVRECAVVIADVLARLTGPLPIRARGMARLRIVLSDGRGPLYHPGRGTLAAAMRGVLAAM